MSERRKIQYRGQEVEANSVEVVSSHEGWNTVARMATKRLGFMGTMRLIARRIGLTAVV